MKKKNLIFILVIIAIIILVIFIKNKTNNVENKIEENINIEEIKENVIPAEYIQTLEDGTLRNNSEKLKENKKIDGLETTRILITAKEETTIMMLDIKNISKDMKGNKEVTLLMKDKEGNEIGKIGVFISEIKPNDSITLELNTSKNFINTYDFEILDQKLLIND